MSLSVPEASLADRLAEVAIEAFDAQATHDWGP